MFSYVVKQSNKCRCVICDVHVTSDNSLIIAFPHDEKQGICEHCIELCQKIISDIKEHEN